MSFKTLERPYTRLQPLWKIKDLLVNGSISLDAPYQRDIVWNRPKMCALIDSIMNNYYIPPVVFAVRKVADGRVVRVCIDGKQRLTSILRFMNNEIPYLEMVDGRTVDKFYSSETEEDGRREYLDDNVRDHFDHTELVCVEYTNLDTDSEIEIFSRVQLGVPLTTAEKLKANGTPISEFCQTMYNQYKYELSSLFADFRGRIFQYIAALVLMITTGNKSPSYPCSIKKIDAFLSDSEISLTQDMKRNIAHVINTIVALNKDPSSMVFTHVSGRKTPFRPIEFLMFGFYVSRCRRRRQLKEYESDCAQLRFYLYRNAEHGVRMGTPCYKLAMDWIEQQMDSTGQTPALIQHPGVASSSTDTDEVPDDEEEDENRIEDVLAFYKRYTKRPAADQECLEAAERARPRSRPVACRGGKSPSMRRQKH
ncbi:hypothetical protein BDA99DRAFT_495967 [Phascolomyces articulosus]|uniref:GmrSD restriction endonucleases N-terminal domain-containing protein n=1 Tax=Phascolomyces articulosus TaxID=60185 RepID=A0AAD5PJ25_9FUNG|nr:hypothetical protein BDA99DRAFT_495967 [Phascolomyces articulosus]